MFEQIKNSFQINKFKIKNENDNINLIPKNNLKYISLYENYLSILYEKLIKLINESNFEKIFEEDIKGMMLENDLPKSNYSISSLPIRKEYEIIEEYCHIKPEETKKKMYTTLNPNCNGECCKEYNKLGNLNLENGHWESQCCDRKNNIECIPNLCKCDSKICKNMPFYNKKYKIMNKDVEERYAWGIDLFTYRNLLNLLPDNIERDSEKNKIFIEKTLMNSLSKLNKDGFKMIKGCKYIIDNSFNYSLYDIILANFYYDIFSYSKICEEEIDHAYSKGIGIFCIKKSGIEKNELIAPYFGEIYPPYLWFEKQDLIKRYKLDKNLPDFYNIMVERFKNDNSGYDLLMCDSNSKGSFSSRMSHSCYPNCNTVLTVSNNEYIIGMYATKDIKMDEELTFDYNSYTEKEKEFQDAVCLCSSYNCRGHYLFLSNSLVFTEISNKFHSFLHRNAILLKACFFGNKPLSDKEINILNKYSIKNSLLENTPIWLKRWSALILSFVDLEFKLLPIIMYKAEKQEREEKIKKEKIEKMKEKEREKEKEKEREKEREKKELKQKRRIKNKGQNINYNFDTDYIWNRKSYASRTRHQKNSEENINNNNNNIIDDDNRLTVIISCEGDIIEKKNDDKNNLNIEEEVNKNLNEKNTKSDSLISSNNNNNSDDNHMIINPQIQIKEVKHIIINNFQEKNNLDSNKIILNEDKTKDNDINENKNIKNINNNNQTTNNTYNINTINYNNISINLNDNINEINNKEVVNFAEEEILKMEEKRNKINTIDLIPDINDLSFLSDLNLELEENYDKTLFKNLQTEVKNLITEQRIQNLAITLSKVKHILSLLKNEQSNEPPLRLLTEEEMYNLHWKNLKTILIEKFTYLCSLEQIKQNENLNNIYQKIISQLHYGEPLFKSENFPYYQTNINIRKSLLIVSKLIKKCIEYDKSNNYIFYTALSEIIYLNCKTIFHFTPNSIISNQFEGENVIIRKRDVDSSCIDEKYINCSYDTIIAEGKKEYENNYIWGQLVGWFKQTVDKPNASLSAERRGSLSYPELDSFFSKKDNEKNFGYPCNGRNNFYEKIKENPSFIWPVGNDWSYKNKYKIYGSVQFDSVFLRNFYLNQIKEDVEEVINYFL